MERLAVRKGQAEVADTGPEVEQQRVLTRRGDGDARGVAAVPSDVVAMAWGRAPNTMERDQHALANPLHLGTDFRDPPNGTSRNAQM